MAVRITDWKLAHETLAALAHARARQDHVIGRALIDAFDTRADRELGYGSFAEYAERLFGFSPRYTKERLRVALALRDLPRTARALEQGKVTWSVVRELTRVAQAHSEEEWLDAAKNASVRDVEHLVSRHRRGDRPSDPPRDEIRQFVLRFEVSSEVYALWRDAVGRMRDEAGEDLDEDTAFMMIARRVLEGPTDEGRSTYQISMNECPTCHQVTQDGRGQAVAVASDMAEMAGCDAQRLDNAGRATQDIPPAVRRLVVRRHHGRCGVPGCRSAVFLDVHHVRPRADGGTHDPEGLILLCSAHHRAEHRGMLLIDGTYSAGFVIRHADGTEYGGEANARHASLWSDVFQVLRQCRVAESEAHRAIESIRTHVGPDATLDQAVRLALQTLRAEGRW